MCQFTRTPLGLPERDSSGLEKSQRPLWILAALIGLTLFAIALHVHQLDWGDYEVLNVDEPFFITASRDICLTGDFNYKLLQYPGLGIYLKSAADSVYFLWGLTQGKWAAFSDVPFIEFYRSGRILQSALFILLIPIAYKIGRELYSPLVGLFAALFTSVDTVLIEQARINSIHFPFAFFSTLAFLMIVLAYRRGHTRYFLYAGLLVGAAAGTKYHGILLAFPLAAAAAFVSRDRRIPFIGERLILSLLLVVLGFVICHPYAVLDLQEWLNDMQVVISANRSHWDLEQDRPLAWFMSRFVENTLLRWFCLFGFILALLPPRRSSLLILAFLVPFVGSLANFPVILWKYTAPANPLFFCLGAAALVRTGHWIGKWSGQRPAVRKLRPALILFLILALWPGYFAVRQMVGYGRGFTLVAARDWLAETYPDRERIATSQYLPTLDGIDEERFLGFRSTSAVLDRDHEIYVLNSWVYGRFMEGERFEEHRRQYDRFFRGEDFKEIRRFEAGWSMGGPTVRVFRRQFQTHHDFMAVFQRRQNQSAWVSGVDLGTRFMRDSYPDDWGWYGPETSTEGFTFSWAASSGSRVRIENSRTIQTSLLIRAFTHPIIAGTQKMSIRVNGTAVGEVVLTERPNLFRVDLPSGTVKQGANDVALEFSGSFRPVDVIKGSTDERELSGGVDFVALVDPEKKIENFSLPFRGLNLLGWDRDVTTVALGPPASTRVASRVPPDSFLTVSFRADGHFRHKKPLTAWVVAITPEGRQKRILECELPFDRTRLELRAPLSEYARKDMVFQIGVDPPSEMGTPQGWALVSALAIRGPIGEN